MLANSVGWRLAVLKRGATFLYMPLRRHTSYRTVLMMTSPHERTKAVTDTRELLQMLASAQQISIDGLVQSVALGLLKHYPVEIDLEVSAGVLPGIWASPKRQPADSTSTSVGQGPSPGQRDADDFGNAGDDDQTSCSS